MQQYELRALQTQTQKKSDVCAILLQQELQFATISIRIVSDSYSKTLFFYIVTVIKYVVTFWLVHIFVTARK